MKSGFATVVGRPNVGKSTLVNAILGTKVSITSRVPQTTRTPVRGVLDREGAQVVFVDTPGVHKPHTLLGQRLNQAATDALEGVDVTILVLDARAPLGTGDRYVAARVPPGSLCVVNKVDIASRRQVLEQLQAAASLDLAEYFPVSATTGAGVEALVDAVVARLPEGPPLYPPGTVSDMPEAVWVAELVREQLLAVTRDEVPHSLACRVTEWEGPERPGGESALSGVQGPERPGGESALSGVQGPERPGGESALSGVQGPERPGGESALSGVQRQRIRCEILVERASQRGIVIGRRGEVLKEVGTRVRAALPPGTYLELFVKVEPHWPRRLDALQRLGY